jgi:broad specificity phosphatase PhoE
MKTTKVILIRHTNTGFHGIYFLGKADVPIIKEGVEHAKQIGKVLKNQRIDRIYSSCLRRSIMTAEEIARPRGLKVERRPEFNEIDFGVMDGLTGDEIEKRYPGLIEKRNRDREHFKPPQGESYAEARERAVPAFRKLFDSDPGKTIVVVMHGVLMKLIFKEITGKTIAETGEYVGFGCRMTYEESRGKIRFVSIANDRKSEGGK